MKPHQGNANMTGIEIFCSLCESHLKMNIYIPQFFPIRDQVASLESFKEQQSVVSTVS